MADDWQIIDKWQIIDNWMKAHGTRLTRVIAGMTGDAEAAQDIAQETFIRAYHGLDAFNGKSSPYTYLYRIAGNLVIDYKRAQKRRLRRERGLETFGGEGDVEGEQSLLDTIPSRDASSHPEASAIAGEQIAEVRKALAELPEPYQQTAVFYYLADLSISEISKTIGLSEGTVKSRLFRARKSLSRLLAGGDYAE
jgi:RNA polymerase sigma-70 factor, ECF subfamily